MGPIPWTAIKAYGDHCEMGEEEFSLLEIGVMILDSAHLKQVKADMEKADRKVKKPRGH